MNLYKRVATYGSFDLFHVGHLQLLQRAAELGPLTVFVSDDDFHNEKRGFKPIIPWAQRAAIVGNIKGVHTVFPETSWEQKEADIFHYGIDCIVMGGDWEGKFDHLRERVKVIYLPRTTGVSTTEIKKKMESTNG